MMLTNIITTYERKFARDPHAARDYILYQFFDHAADTLRQSYLGLFMYGDKGTGYDPINGQFYEVDPEGESLYFQPVNYQFMLFRKVADISDLRVPSLRSQGMMPFVRQLQEVSSSQLLDAHLYGPEHDVVQAMESDGELIQHTKRKIWYAQRRYLY